MHTYKVGRDFALSVQSCHTFPRWTTFTKLKNQNLSPLGVSFKGVPGNEGGEDGIYKHFMLGQGRHPDEK
uniref:Uncharacterized protein n=1 Tax=Vitis vinifera TaxID=29760 RepID=F6H5V2_VITVI